MQLFTRKLPLILLLLVSASLLHGQETVFPDYKGDKESLQKVRNKIIREEVAIFAEAGFEEPSSSIKLRQVPRQQSAETTAVFRLDSVQVLIKTSRFVPKQHHIKYIDRYAAKIDGHPIWGTDGELPKTSIQSIRLIIAKDTLSLPSSSFADLYEPDLGWVTKETKSGGIRVFYTPRRERIYIYMANSDGAGFYEVTFVISNKKYLRRIIDYGF